jgi:hypothetical protein
MAQATKKSIADAFDDPDCPVMTLATKIEGLRDARNELEELVIDHDVDGAIDDLFEAKRTLEQVVTLTRATSRKGALYQLALLCETMDELMGNLDGAEQFKKLRPFEASARRLAYSIAGVLRQGIDDGEADRLMGLYMSPDKDELRKFDLGCAGKPVAPLFTQTKRRSKETEAADLAKALLSAPRPIEPPKHVG